MEIVEARSEHGPFIAWAVLTAFRSHHERGLWDLYVGETEEVCLRFLRTLAATKTRHWAHYSNFIIAEADGAVTAALSGYFAEECGTPQLLAGIAEANAALGRTPEDDAAGWRRAGSILYVMPDFGEGAWIIENVATRPEFRRRGLIDVLLAEILAIGRRRGTTTADVGVMIGNDRAQRAYEKAGFAVVSEKRHPKFEAAYGSPGMRLLRRTVSPA